MSISQTISAIVDIPSTSAPATFAATADALLGTDLPLLVSQINTWAGQANTMATTLNADAVQTAADHVATTASAAAASASASAAAGSATGAAGSATTATAQAAIATAAASAVSFLDTSTTTNTVGTGAKSFTLASAANYQAGQYLLISDQANSANYMLGTVTSYNPSTLALVINSLVTGGSGSKSAWNVAISGVPGPTGPAPTIMVAWFHQEQTSGTGPSEGAFTNNTWNQRALNTTKLNTITSASLASNQISLPAGTYEVFAQAGARFDTSAQTWQALRLRNITDSTTIMVGPGQQDYANTIPWAGTLVMQGSFTIAGTKTVELEQWVKGSANAFGGIAVSSGEVEVYVDLYFRKVA